MKYRYLAIALAIPLMGASCNFNSTVSAICGGVSQAYVYYDEVAASGVLSASVQNYNNAIRREVNYACANPTTVTPAQMAGIAAKAYVALKAAYAKGGDSTAAQMGYSKITDLKRLLEAARRK